MSNRSIAKCAQCGKRFERANNRMNEAAKNGWTTYCSKKCQYEARLRGEQRICSNPKCKKRFYRRDSQIKKVERSYCSRSCAAIINNAANPKRSAVVKPCANRICDEDAGNGNLYCSRKCFNISRLTFKPDELIRKLQEEAQKLKRSPAKRELGPAADMCVRAFGSWNLALVSAGLLPHRSHSERMFRRKKSIAFDGHRCDSISEVLIDNWLNAHGISHQRSVSYPDTGHTADWSIGESIFIEYFGLAHDSPRYDRTIKKKKRLCKKHNIALIELYASDLYPKIQLDAKLKPFIKET